MASQESMKDTGAVRKKVQASVRKKKEWASIKRKGENRQPKERKNRTLVVRIARARSNLCGSNSKSARNMIQSKQVGTDSNQERK
ncbi:hypothetical protein HanRHA438_Chr08g0350281 [Helianthus annuus]|nr:hypothetical protein HanIR_Chr01g0014061 [Helianthus annuus]KAJ0897852.1 hypothetical protein HanRHA438_Chr08g0350281 [Helianthus annuus]